MQFILVLGQSMQQQCLIDYYLHTMFSGLISSTLPATAQPDAAGFFSSVLTCMGHSGGGFMPAVLKPCGVFCALLLFVSLVTNVWAEVFWASDTVLPIVLDLQNRQTLHIPFRRSSYSGNQNTNGESVLNGFAYLRVNGQRSMRGIIAGNRRGIRQNWTILDRNCNPFE